MMTKSDVDLLKRLHTICEAIPDEFSRAVFYRVCIGLQLRKQGLATTKYVTKEQILEYLVTKGLARRRPNGDLPDDRTVREAARELLKQGYPIMATSAEKGYFIAERTEEIDLPQKQNYDRAVAILAVDKGYNKVRAFLAGQMSFFD